MAVPVTKNTDWVDVRDWDATPGGANTQPQIQRCLDENPGRTVVVPAGVWGINPDYNAGGSLRMSSNQTLWLEPGCVIRSVPTALTHYAMVQMDGVTNAHITSSGGGRIEGDMAAHTGTTGEFGFGVWIQASRDCSVSRVDVSDCWGDSIVIFHSGVGSLNENIDIDEVRCFRSRRQGISITHGRRIRIRDVFCQDIGRISGTAPSGGIDIEAEGVGSVEGVLVANFQAVNCAGAGLIVAGGGDDASDVHVIGGQASRCGRGFIAGGITTLTVEGFDCLRSELEGVLLGFGAVQGSIRFGRIEDGASTGLTIMGNAPNSQVHQAIIRRNAGAGIIVAGDGSTVEGLIVERNAAAGAIIQGANVRLDRSTFRNAGATTAHLSAASAAGLVRRWNTFDTSGLMFDPVGVLRHDIQGTALVSDF